MRESATHRLTGLRAICWAAVATVIPLLPAIAQDTANAAAALRRSCRADYAAHCTGENPAPAIERACLAQFYVNLSGACRTALDAARAAAAGDSAPPVLPGQ